MAAVGPPPVLPVPAPAPATFASKFSDASVDPTGGNVSALMSPFLHSLTDPNQNTDTNTIKDRLATSGAQRQFIAATIVSNGKSRLYICPHRWDEGLIGTNPDLNNKFFAFEGELVANSGHTVEIDTSVFNLFNNQLAVPTVNHITSSIASDPNLEMLGPYTANDAHTEPVKTRRIVPIPHFLAGLWMPFSEGITAKYFWETVYPAIQAAGFEADCKALIQFFQIMITRAGNQGNLSALEVTRPTPPARNIHLINRQLEILHHHFPQLRPDTVVQQTNLIAAGLGTLAQQQRDQYEEQKQEKELAKLKTFEKWVGRTTFLNILKMLQVANELQLVRECPVYKDMAEAKSAERMGVLQAAVDALLVQRGIKHFGLILSPGLFSNITTWRWWRTHEDSIATGLFGNAFLFGETDEEHQQSVNRQVGLVQSGEHSVSHTDAKDILKVSVNLPRENKSLDNLKRMEILASVLLPDSHPFLTYLRAHVAQFGDFLHKWEGVELSDPRLQPAKGVLHLQWWSLRSSIYWRNQTSSVTPIALPSPSELMDEIELKKQWEPTISTNLRQTLKLDAFCRLGEATGLKGATISMDNASLASGLTSTTKGSTLTVEDLFRYLGAAGAQSPAGGAGAGGASGTSKTGTGQMNVDFNEHKFGELKRRKQNGNMIKCRDIRMRIRRQELPELPPSKVDNQPMCLAWHVKGLCNPDCPRAADHVKYESAEYDPLFQWCVANYPKDE